MSLPDLTISEPLDVSDVMETDKLFEKNYIAARTKEKRMYTDEETASLPEIYTGHPHQKEWLIRKYSGEKLIGHIESRKYLINILEVGCGNGWLSSKLSGIPGTQTTGLDINLTELHQAERVFKKKSNLKFVYGNIHSGILNGLSFDVIVFAASIQYFHSLPDILNICLEHLDHKGEIHIIDSAFYKNGEIGAAKQRSMTYYSNLGFPELASHYFHHSFSEIQAFNYTLFFDPSSMKNRFFGRNHPFPWICIKRD